MRASHVAVLTNSEPPPTTRSLMRNCDARMTGGVHKRFHEQQRNWSVLPKPRSVIAAVAVCVAMYLGSAPTLRAAPQQHISGNGVPAHDRHDRAVISLFLLSRRNAANSLTAWLCNRRVFRSRRTFAHCCAQTLSRNRTGTARLFFILSSAFSARQLQRVGLQMRVEKTPTR